MTEDKWLDMLILLDDLDDRSFIDPDLENWMKSHFFLKDISDLRRAKVYLCNLMNFESEATAKNSTGKMIVDFSVDKVIINSKISHMSFVARYNNTEYVQGGGTLFKSYIFKNCENKLFFASDEDWIREFELDF